MYFCVAVDINSGDCHLDRMSSMLLPVKKDLGRNASPAFFVRNQTRKGRITFQSLSVQIYIYSMGIDKD